MLQQQWGEPEPPGDLAGPRDEWAGNQKVIDLKMAFVNSDAGEDEVRELIMRRCSEWLKPIPPPEKSEVKKGEWVHLTESPRKHDSSLLSMMFGSMGELLNGMDLISRRFRDVCTLDDDAKKKHKVAIRKMLKAGSGDPSTLRKLGVPIERLPRVLLLGETGVGKTLFAKYLAGTASDFKKVPPLRERRADFPFILDCLLQNPDINPPGEREVTEIGCDAFQAIKQHEFKGNFRELENMLRAACQRAARENRRYLCKDDLSQAMPGRIGHTLPAVR